MKRLLVGMFLMVASSGLAAQEHASPAAPAAEHKLGPTDILMPHLTDSKHFEYPCFRGFADRSEHGVYEPAWACELQLPTWEVAGVDLGPTKHTVWLFIAASFVAIVLITAARKHQRQTLEGGRPRGFAAALEAVILYLRNEIYLPVLGGHGGEKYVPFCLSLFFFILVCNAFGLIPYGSTATGNLAVTATLAIITFFMIEIGGMRALGKGYFNTIVYWPHDMSIGLKLPLTLIMTPIEIISKFTKPFALTIRLFANMIAGHVIILSLIGMIFLFGALVAVPAVAMALFISGLEILVVVIQAFIFSLLAAVFIGQIRSAHH